MSKVPARQDDPTAVDELYGLEPVLEPGEGEAARPESLQTSSVQCPYCGERFETVVDLSAGSTGYIEDCRVCCRPIDFRLEVADDGTLACLEARRGD